MTRNQPYPFLPRMDSSLQLLAAPADDEAAILAEQRRQLEARLPGLESRAAAGDTAAAELLRDIRAALEEPTPGNSSPWSSSSSAALSAGSRPVKWPPALLIPC